MEFPVLTLVGFLLQEKPEGAIILRLVPPKSDLETLSDILIKSLGLSGVLALAGLVLGMIAGGIVFLIRYRSSLQG